MATKKAEEQQIKQEMERAERAKSILGNPLFNESFSAMKEEIFKQWLQTAPADVKSREWFHKMAVASARLQKMLATHITTGNMAAAMSEANRKAAEAKRPTRRA